MHFISYKGYENLYQHKYFIQNKKITVQLFGFSVAKLHCAVLGNSALLSF